MLDRNNSNERYTFTSDKTIRKVDLENNADLNGVEFHLISKLEDGYSVYQVGADPSQPSPSYFIHQKYFVEVK